MDTNIVVIVATSNPWNDGAYWYGIREVSCNLNTECPEEQVLLEIETINKDFTAIILLVLLLCFKSMVFWDEKLYSPDYRASHLTKR